MPNPAYPYAVVVLKAERFPGIKGVYLVDLRTARHRRFARSRRCFFSMEGVQGPWSPKGRYLALMEGDVIEDDLLRTGRAIRVFDLRRLSAWFRKGRQPRGIRLTGGDPRLAGMTAYFFERWVAAETLVYISKCCNALTVHRYRAAANKRERLGSCPLRAGDHACKWLKAALRPPE